ncbi:hypothetical protein [Niallia sp. Krafla_26]|uniref:hypothetical protein n=1 Tax=Niallia sp. Krafla_26 TaxID=3064703 RepID=UPI003D16AD93
MAHNRKDSSRPTATISFDPEVLEKIEDFRFENRMENRSRAIEELVKYGFKYIALIDKKNKEKQK